MFERILVPLDGSRRAEQALPIAARLARASGGTVVLLRAVSIPNEFASYLTLESIPMQSDIDAAQDEASIYLRGMTTASSLTGVHTETEVTLGQAATTILSAVDAHHIGLTVLCSHGYTGLTRWLMGSVAEKVAYHSPVPVLVLREGGTLPVGLHLDAGSPLRVLVPLDGSLRARAAIAPAAQLSVALSAPARGALHLTRVVVRPDPDEISHQTQEIIGHKAKEYLNAVVEQTRDGLLSGAVADPRLVISWSVTIDEDIASGIIRAAEDSADVIAMTTHGSHGLQRWVMGSITGRVLHATGLPLLIVRPPDMLDKAYQG